MCAIIVNLSKIALFDAINSFFKLRGKLSNINILSIINGLLLVEGHTIS